MTEDMMKTIAIEFNNVGCLLIDQGCNNEAVSFIGKGITFVARSIRGNALPSPEQLKDIRRQIHASATSCSADKRTMKDKYDHQAGPSICRQTFPISSPPLHKGISDSSFDFDDDDNDATMSMDSIASRLLYHRALAMHLKAIKEGKALFGVILRQYACIKDLLMGNSTTHIEEDDFPIALAILNNEAHCHYEMSEFRLSQELFEDLVSMLDYHSSFHERSPDGKIESLCSLNCIVYKEPPSIARAA